MTLARHPAPRVLASQLRSLAHLLDTHGTDATRTAALLAARGWPTATLGDGTPRSSDTTSSVERATDDDRSDRYDDIDHHLANHLRILWKAATQIEITIADLLAHADDNDPLPAGTGSCRCCDRMCRPNITGGPEDRLRAGYCPACNMAWTRAGRPDKTDFDRQRRAELKARVAS